MKKLSILILCLSLLCGACAHKASTPGGVATGGLNAATGTPAPSGAASITQAVLASRTTPLTHTPIDVTQAFPSADGVIHAVASVANAPAGTRLRGVLTAVDTSNAQPANTKIGEIEATTESTQNVEFLWKYVSFPVGTYKVDIYLNGALDRSLNLSVTKDATPPPAAAPATIGNCPPLKLDEKPFFPIGVSIAQGADSQGKPLNPGRIFQPTSPSIYAVLSLENVPANTRLSARWFGTDLGGVEACNTQIGSFDMAASAGSSNPYFSIAPPADSKWPEGLYRVDVYANDQLTMSTDFGVCDGQCKFQVPIGWKLP